MTLKKNTEGVYENQQPSADESAETNSAVPVAGPSAANPPTEPRTAPADLEQGINIRAEAGPDVVGSKISVSVTNLSGKPLSAIRIEVDGQQVYWNAGSPDRLGSKFSLRRGQLGHGRDHSMTVEAWGTDGAHDSEVIKWQTA